ncbi:MAG: DUF6290 family protein [Streptococcaceae bacterium]|nr:DUF6290 family protein [Streptococcaceae bacterium]
MTTMTLRIENEDSELIKNFTKLHGLTISEFARQAMLEKIEDEYDLKILRKAMAENGDEPGIPLADIMKEYGL